MSMDDASITLETLNDKLDNLSRLTLIGSKTVLDFDETLLFTGLSRGYLYRLTARRRYRSSRRTANCNFKKSDLENWMLERRCSDIR